MLRIFKFDPEYLRMSINGEVSDVGLNMSANPHGANGCPCGLVSSHGLVYNTVPDGLPACIIRDSGIRITLNYSVTDIKLADVIFSGSYHLVDNFKKVEINKENGYIKRPTVTCNRYGIGILENGQPVILHNRCTLYELQDAFMALNAHSAMSLGNEDDLELFCEGKDSSVDYDHIPAVVLNIRGYEELPRPFIVIDPGHGGSDYGGKTLPIFEYRSEKEINLRRAVYIQSELQKRFLGTFLLTRDADVFMSLADRTTEANAINADFFLSIHHNASSTHLESGFESFIYRYPLEKTKQIQEQFHKIIANFYAKYGFTDRGRKTSGFYVLKHTACPALLTEDLFLDYEKDVKFLNRTWIIKQLNEMYIKAFEKVFSLKPRLATTMPNGTLYNVVAGSFQIQENAERLKQELIEKGYNAYIDIKKPGI